MFRYAGALHPSAVRQTATPRPPRPPKPNAALMTEGKTAMQSALSSIPCGIALVGRAHDFAEYRRGLRRLLDFVVNVLRGRLREAGPAMPTTRQIGRLSKTFSYATPPHGFLCKGAPTPLVVNLEIREICSERSANLRVTSLGLMPVMADGKWQRHWQARVCASASAMASQ